MSNAAPTLYTIGHSNHSADHFQGLLADCDIEVLVDVRSWPHSRYVEWADRDALADICRPVGAKYLFLGDQLGGRPDDPLLYDADGHVLYGKVAATEHFRRGVARLLRGLGKCRVAIMCSEENPEHCHRRLLVSKVMIDEGCAVQHIRGDGNIEFERGPILPMQESLLADEESQWRSSLSVSRKPPRTTFSTA
jgi:uncharacterized protein (DUF488 family)